MRQVVDARGLACPQPVVLTGKALAVADEVTVLVDDPVAVENVSRLARSKGFSVEKATQPDGTRLTLRREGAPAGESAPEPLLACPVPTPAGGPLVLFVPTEHLGVGAAELGERLMGAFFHTLLEVSPRPQVVIFMNTGVKLAAEGSRAVEDLRALAGQGVDILACGTCLGYYGLTEKLAVGRVSNMYDIASALLGAGRVVAL